jgi:putative ABC transport system ATP-binding protein
MALFHQLNTQGVTLIVVTHDHEIADQCKRSIVLRDGKILEDKVLARPAAAS